MWGKVINGENHPVAQSRILLSKNDSPFTKEFHPDSSGLFQIVGIPTGSYSLQVKAQGYQTCRKKRLFLNPSQDLMLKVILLRRNEKSNSSIEVFRISYSDCTVKTTLLKSQIHGSPSAHNVWSLIENQDLSATTNRIDVGGLWGTKPALFSSRVSCSWTQNRYLLNGMDVTDPYRTGKPLFFPDFFTLRATQLVNAGMPPQALSPGGHFNLITRRETQSWHGEVSAYFIHPQLQSSNISPSLQKEGLHESHKFNSLVDSHFHLSGPLFSDKLSMMASLSGFYVSRDIAEFEKEDKSSVGSGLFSLKYRTNGNSLRLLWTGQRVNHPSYGARRQIPFSSTSNRKENYNVFQAIWKTRPHNHHFFKLGFSFTLGSIRSSFQQETSGPYKKNLFNGTLTGAAPYAREDNRTTLSFLFKGNSVFPQVLKARHRLQYGLKFKHSSSSSQKEIWGNRHLRFFNKNPLQIIEYNTPIHHREAAFHVNFFAQDSLTFPNRFSFYWGLNLAFSRGWIPSEETFNLMGNQYKIQWFHLSPRLGVIIPLTPSKKSVLKLSAARYYFTLPLHYLTYGNSNSLGGKTYSWIDANEDDVFQEGEKGPLLRREGPFYSKIDPDLQRPHTDELALTYNHQFGKSWTFSMGFFIRKTRNLIETYNIGVPISSYTPSYFFDRGDDRVPYSHDELMFTVYNQKKSSLGQDFFLLTNDSENERISTNYGLDIVLLKKYSSKFTMFLSLQAIHAVGRTSPGNTAMENDNGVIGSLYDNPNSFINTKGRLHFDRGYTGRLGFTYKAPLEIRVGGIIKYYDGQPFSRKIIVTGMNQGPFSIQAHPRGVSRYEYNRTVDVRIEKIFSLDNNDIRLILDCFNLLNRGLATEEDEWTSPDYPLRHATEIQSPRVFRLGVSYEF
ncbi:carboxypeptidase regulatory-like domain-containing protein [bacterium]|nr:carboxypeptidase regulatory-like domain-containing protein [bacterium]